MSLESEKKTSGRRPGATLFLFTRLALQNVLRRPARTLMLVLAVTLSTGGVFASYTVASGIKDSMDRSFSRMGADLIVVPSKAMVNITSALLTVQPTDEVIDEKLVAEIERLDGIAQAAPQTYLQVPIMSGMPECKANLIAFDAKKDFTVLPWMVAHAPRAMVPGDIVAGSRRSESIGDEIAPGNQPVNIYGKLGRSGVGPLDDSFFTTYETVEMLHGKVNKNSTGTESLASFDRSKISAILVKLKFGATPEQARFAIAKLPGVKVVTGATIVTSTRQATTALLGGMLGFTGMMLVAMLIMVSLLFSGIISERRREVGLLRAIGSRHVDVLRMLLAEAVFTTMLGGITGIVFGAGLLLVFQRSLVYYLETLHIDFAWPEPVMILCVALICAVASALVGLAGALVPAWKACLEEPYLLIQGEGG
ncbi:MAG TPA: ABC transporter permease [Candidatus Melainabacteria bacterium]|nr:ABC transporter permease [Candidatus Melainabacteria bacterium]HIN63145.1 ABC transporter permease [Candidatus Obscuribacterales bacterium]